MSLRPPAADDWLAGPDQEQDGQTRAAHGGPKRAIKDQLMTLHMNMYRSTLIRHAGKVKNDVQETQPPKSPCQIKSLGLREQPRRTDSVDARKTSKQMQTRLAPLFLCHLFSPRKRLLHKVHTPLVLPVAHGAAHLVAQRARPAHRHGHGADLALHLHTQ